MELIIRFLQNWIPKSSINWLNYNAWDLYVSSHTVWRGSKFIIINKPFPTKIHILEFYYLLIKIKGHRLYKVVFTKDLLHDTDQIIQAKKYSDWIQTQYEIRLSSILSMEYWINAIYNFTSNISHTKITDKAESTLASSFTQRHALD